MIWLVKVTSWWAVALNFSVCLARRIFFKTYLTGREKNPKINELTDKEMCRQDHYLPLLNPKSKFDSDTSCSQLKSINNRPQGCLHFLSWKFYFLSSPLQSLIAKSVHLLQFVKTQKLSFSVGIFKKIHRDKEQEETKLAEKKKKSFLLLFLSFMKNKKSRTKSSSTNLFNDFIIFHFGFPFAVICLHWKP